MSPTECFTFRRAAARSAASARSSPPIRSPARLDDRADRHEPRPLGLWPQLSLSYDSGAGNGPFGFGWSLSLPAITRKTDKGLPQYSATGPTSSSSPAPKTWCRCLSKRRAVGTGTNLSAPWTVRAIASNATARASKGCSPASSAGPTRRSGGHPLALDLQGQHHHLVRQDGREPHRRSRRSHPHLQLADLRELRRQGQRHRLRVRRGELGRRRPRRRPTSATARPRSAPPTAT